MLTLDRGGVSLHLGLFRESMRGEGRVKEAVGIIQLTLLGLTVEKKMQHVARATVREMYGSLPSS